MFCYAYHFTHASVFNIYITTAIGNGQHLPMLLRRRHGTGKEEGNFSAFQGIQCGMFIKV